MYVGLSVCVGLKQNAWSLDSNAIASIVIVRNDFVSLYADLRSPRINMTITEIANWYDIMHRLILKINFV